MTQEVNPQNKPFIRSQETIALVSRLEQVQEEEFISYAELSEIVGFDVQKNRHYLSSARDIIQQDKQYHFETQNGKGLVRVPDTEYSLIVNERFTKRIKNETKRTKKKIQAINYDKLSTAEARQSYVLTAAFTSLTEACVSTQTRNSIKAKAAENRNQVLDMQASVRRIMEGVL